MNANDNSLKRIFLVLLCCSLYYHSGAFHACNVSVCVSLFTFLLLRSTDLDIFDTT